MSPHSLGTKILHTKLDRVEQRSRQDAGAVFNNLGHLIDLKLLRRCYSELDGNKAAGIDGVTKEAYGRGGNLIPKLRRLLLEIRQGSYHPRASRIVEIPKASGGTRPLAICCFEDKIVQDAVRRIVERIYEPLFMKSSHGFRPGRDCRTALVALGGHLMSGECGAVLEIDLQKYFNTIPHEPLIEMLGAKISDKRFLRLIIKLLKAPIQTLSGKEERQEIGSPQGSILSPVISNVYLHYVLDTWFEWINTNHFGAKARMVRYADDAVFVFRTIQEAELFRLMLTQRLGEFGIKLHEGKTTTMVSGSREAMRRHQAGLRMPAFTFLGFLHVWGISENKRTGNRFCRVKRRTCPVRYRMKLAAIYAYIRKHRHEKDLLLRVKRITQGYLNYFAVSDNSKRICQFVYEVKRILFKWLNRRSQRRSLTWEQFDQILRKISFPQARILHNLFTDSRATVCR